MNKVILLLLLVTLLQANTCKKDANCLNGSHNNLIIKNNNSKRINYEFYWNYPDTIIPDKFSPLHYWQYELKTGDSVFRSAGRGGCWEAEFIRKPKEYIYFFDEDSLEQISWDTIRATNRGILERRELTLDYLKRNNFVITYP